jgi:hypothetical protein
MRRTIMATATGLFIGGAGVLALALPASAATTPVTVEITGGDLAISAPATSVDLGTTAGSSSTQAVTGSLGDVVVSDQRAGVAGWVATAGSTNFTGSAGGSISNGTVSYVPGTAGVVGTATVTPISLDAMPTPGTVQTATAVSGDNTGTWDPSITVPLPAGALAGTYGATITHSVSLPEELKTAGASGPSRPLGMAPVIVVPAAVTGAVTAPFRTGSQRGGNRASRR